MEVYSSEISGNLIIEIFFVFLNAGLGRTYVIFIANSDSGQEKNERQ